MTTTQSFNIPGRRELEPRIADSLKVGERRHEDFLLVGVLGEPGDISAAIDLPHFDLEEDREPALHVHVAHRNRHVRRRAQHPELDAPAAPERVLHLELLWQHHARAATKHLAVRRKHEELAQLDDSRHDAVDRRRVSVAVAR
eukprot:2306047-Rhodomonas_salina.1